MYCRCRRHPTATPFYQTDSSGSVTELPREIVYILPTRQGSDVSQSLRLLSASTEVGDAGGNTDPQGTPNFSNPPTESLATATLAALGAAMAVQCIQMDGVQEAVKDMNFQFQWLASRLVPQQCQYTGVVMRIKSEMRPASVVDATEDMFGTAEKRDLFSDGRQTARRPRQSRSLEQRVLSDCRDADTYVAHYHHVNFSTTFEQQQCSRPAPLPGYRRRHVH